MILEKRRFTREEINEAMVRRSKKQSSEEEEEQTKVKAKTDKKTLDSKEDKR